MTLDWLERRTLNISWRMRLLQGLICTLALCVSARLYYLQGQDQEKWRSLASRQHDSTVQIQAARGDIYDIEGRLLATSVRATSLGLHPKEAREIPQFSGRLAKLIGLPEKEIQSKINSDKSFLWLARGLPLDIEKELKDSGLSSAIALVPEFKRYYPQGVLAGPILGRISRDGAGLSGIELQYNRQLAAANQSFSMRRDAKGRLLPAELLTISENYQDSLSNIPEVFGVGLSARSNTEVKIRNEGQDVHLSIDSLFQEIVEEEIKIAQQSAQAKRVFAVLLDADKGEILSLAQTPGIDPNSQENLSPELLRNSVLQDSFEPGSTLKPLVAALALDAGIIRAEQQFDCEMGHFVIGPHVIGDVHPEGILPLRDVLIRSSNVCMAKIGLSMGRERLARGLRKLGFGQLSGIELPGEAKGIFRRVEDWAEVDVATHAFGQGVAVTALQLVQAYGALANGGLLHRPTLLKDASKEATRVFSAQTARQISDMLKGVTQDEHGTGQKASIAGLDVMGKTGTAQKPRSDGKGYDPEKILASFVGFVDGENIGLKRRLVLLVAVDEPGVKPRWGGVVAAPAFKRIMERVLAQLFAASSTKPSGEMVNTRMTPQANPELTPGMGIKKNPLQSACLSAESTSYLS